jgi:hypothetical protein
VCGRTACTVRGGGGRKPGQSGSNSRTAQAPPADPTAGAGGIGTTASHQRMRLARPCRPRRGASIAVDVALRVDDRPPRRCTGQRPGRRRAAGSRCSAARGSRSCSRMRGAAPPHDEQVRTRNDHAAIVAVALEVVDPVAVERVSLGRWQGGESSLGGPVGADEEPPGGLAGFGGPAADRFDDLELEVASGQAADVLGLARVARGSDWPRPAGCSRRAP